MYFDLGLLTKMGESENDSWVGDCYSQNNFQISPGFWFVGKPLSRAEAISNTLPATEIQKEQYWDSNL